MEGYENGSELELQRKEQLEQPKKLQKSSPIEQRGGGGLPPGGPIALGIRTIETPTKNRPSCQKRPGEGRLVSTSHPGWGGYFLRPGEGRLVITSRPRWGGYFLLAAPIMTCQTSHL
ncbi:hypothetical protein QJS10_CPB04g01427 [Acorus calamus]|uniref:Uncharacterized protein n=1 Tax=Acorus calamus TaxID=4465 RepID=A0AAV9F074_ACOCL|nr:hypothetical protein QJS10_CPB04g01427 [Acorus calamus]